jgi:hypothetical protein
MNRVFIEYQLAIARNPEPVRNILSHVGLSQRVELTPDRQALRELAHLRRAQANS